MYNCVELKVQTCNSKVSIILPQAKIAKILASISSLYQAIHLIYLPKTEVIGELADCFGNPEKTDIHTLFLMNSTNFPQSDTNLLQAIFAH